jgi:amino acid transporter
MREATGLVRVLGPLDVLMLSFVLPAVIYIGHYLPIAAGLYPGMDFFQGSIFILAFIPLSAIYILFSVAMPRSGGEYVYVSRTVSPGWGFFAAYALLVGGPIASSVSIAEPAITYGLGHMFAVWGIETGSKSSFNLGVALTMHAGIPGFIVMAVFWILCFAIAGLGMRVIRQIVWVTALSQWIALAVYVAVVSTTNLSTISANMASMTGVTYQQVISTAQSVGWSPGLYSLQATVYAGFTYVALVVFGWTFVANVAGEVKHRSMARSMFLGQIGSLILFTIFCMIFSGVTYLGYTRDFVNALGFLADSGKDVTTFGVPFGLSYGFAFATTNPWLAIVPSIGYFLASIGITVTMVAAGTRTLFAFSFDGILPAAMAKIDSRGSPWVATIVLLVPSLIFLVVGQFTSWLSLFAFLIVFWFMAYFVVSLAAIAFPFKRKDLFEKSPPLTQKKIFGVPLLTLVGIFTAAECVYAIWAIISPTLSGGFLAFEPLITSTAVPLIAGWIIYGFFYYYYRSSRADFELRFKEIPPE